MAMSTPPHSASLLGMQMKMAPSFPEIKTESDPQQQLGAPQLTPPQHQSASKETGVLPGMAHTDSPNGMQMEITSQIKTEPEDPQQQLGAPQLTPPQHQSAGGLPGMAHTDSLNGMQMEITSQIKTEPEDPQQQQGPPHQPPSQDQHEENLGANATVSPILYCNMEHPELIHQYPEWTARSDVIYRLWNKLTQKKKKPYLLRAKNNRKVLSNHNSNDLWKNARRQQPQPMQGPEVFPSPAAEPDVLSPVHPSPGVMQNPMRPGAQLMPGTQGGQFTAHFSPGHRMSGFPGSQPYSYPHMPSTSAADPYGMLPQSAHGPPRPQWPRLMQPLIAPRNPYSQQQLGPLHPRMEHPMHHPTIQQPQPHPKMRHPMHHPVLQHQQLHPRMEHPMHHPAVQQPQPHPRMEHPMHHPAVQQPQPYPRMEHPMHHPELQHLQPHQIMEHPMHHPELQHLQPHQRMEHPMHHPVLQHLQPHPRMEHPMHLPVLQHPQPNPRMEHPMHLPVLQHLQPHSRMEHPMHLPVLQHPQPNPRMEHPMHLPVLQHPQPNPRMEHPTHYPAVQHPESQPRMEHPMHHPAVQHSEPSVGHAETDDGDCLPPEPKVGNRYKSRRECLKRRLRIDLSKVVDTTPTKKKHKKKTYACSITGCTKRFTSPGPLFAHVKDAHQSNQRPLNMQNLLDNDAEQQSKSVGTYCWLDCPGLKTYACSITGCTKRFTSPGPLFEHVKDAHRSNQRTYVCNISGCTKPFTSPSRLFAHVKDSHSKDQGCTRRNKHENVTKKSNSNYESSIISEDDSQSNSEDESSEHEAPSNREDENSKHEVPSNKEDKNSMDEAPSDREDEAPSDSEDEYLPQPSNSENETSSNNEDDVPSDSEDDYVPQKSKSVNETSSSNEDESTQTKKLLRRRKTRASYRTKKHQKKSVPSSNIPRIARPQTAAVDYQSTDSTGSLSSLSATSNLNGVSCTMNDLDSVMAVISKQRREGQHIPVLDKRQQGSVNEDFEPSLKRQKTKPKIKVVGYPSSTGSGVKNVFICVQCDSKFSSLVETVKHIDTHVMEDNRNEEGSVDNNHIVLELDSVHEDVDEQNKQKISSSNKRNSSDVTVFGEGISKTKDDVDNCCNSVDEHTNTNNSNRDLKINSESAIETKYQIAKLDDLQRNNRNKNNIESHCEGTKEIIFHKNGIVADIRDQNMNSENASHLSCLISSKSLTDDIEGNVKTDSVINIRNESDVIDSEDGMLDEGLDHVLTTQLTPKPDLTVSGDLEEVNAVNAKSDIHSLTETDRTCNDNSVLPSNESKVIEAPPSLSSATPVQKHIEAPPSLSSATQVQKHIEACSLDKTNDKSHSNLATEKEKSKSFFFILLRPNLQHTGSEKVHNIADKNGRKILLLPTTKQNGISTVTGTSNAVNLLQLLQTTKKKELPTVSRTSNVKLTLLPTTKKKVIPTVPRTSNVRKMPTSCERCNIQFSSIMCLFNHLIIHHHPSYASKKYELTFCHCLACPNSNTLFNSYISTLEQHNRGRGHSVALKVHLKAVHDIEDLKCMHCNSKFNNYSDYHKHVHECCKSSVHGRYCTDRTGEGKLKHLHCPLCKSMHVIKDKMTMRNFWDVKDNLPDELDTAVLRRKVAQLEDNAISILEMPRFCCKECGMHLYGFTCFLNHIFQSHKIDLISDIPKIDEKDCHMKDEKRKVCGKKHSLPTAFVEHVKNILQNNGLLPVLNRKKQSIEDSEYSDSDLEDKEHLKTKGSNDKVKEAQSSAKLVSEVHPESRSKCKTNPSPKEVSQKSVLTKETEIAEKFVKTDLADTVINECKASEPHIAETKTKEATIDSQPTESLVGSPKDSVLLNDVKRYLLVDKSFLTPQNYCLRFNPITAKTKEEIGDHMVERINATVKGFECGICFQQFKEYSCCKNHVLTDHKTIYIYEKGSEVFTCPMCSVSLNVLSSFQEHLEFHGIFNFRCDQCNIKFNRQKEFEKHKKHRPPSSLFQPDPRFSCKHCSCMHNCIEMPGEANRCREKGTGTLATNSIASRKRNINTISVNSSILDKSQKTDLVYSKVSFDGDKYVCTECMDSFDFLDCCTTHILYEHKKLFAKYCLICKNDEKHDNMVAHLRRWHNTMPIYCKKCNKGFSNSVELKLHFPNCSESLSLEEKRNPYICQKCFQLHVPYRSGKIDMQSCKECQQGFQSISCARNHYFVEHIHEDITVTSKLNTFHCPCGKRFVCRSELYQHMKNKHEKVKECEKIVENSPHTLQMDESVSNELNDEMDIDSTVEGTGLDKNSMVQSPDKCGEFEVKDAEQETMAHHNGIKNTLFKVDKEETHSKCPSVEIGPREEEQTLTNDGENGRKSSDSTISILNVNKEGIPSDLSKSSSKSIDHDDNQLNEKNENTTSKNVKMSVPDQENEGNRCDESLKTQSICHQAETDKFKPTEHGQFDNWTESDKAWKKCDACSHLHIITSETVKNVNKKTRATCGICKQKFKDQKCALHHELIAHPNNNHLYQCVGCNLYFVNSLTLRTHQGRPLEDKECTVAPEVTLTDGNKLKDSVTSKSKISTLTGTGDIQSFSCKVEKCKKCAEIHLSQFDMKENKARANLKMEHDSRQSTVKLSCHFRYCNFTTNSLTAFKKHKQEEHSNGHLSQSNICPVCNAKFSSTKEVMHHAVEDHGKVKFVKGELIEDINRMYGCKYCPKKYQFAMDCQMHLRIEHFEKPLVMECHKSYQDKMTKFPVPLCPICFKVNIPDYTKKKQKTTKCHMRQHFFIGKHAKPRSYVCTKCGNEGLKTCRLCVHEKKMKCDICGKTYSSAEALRTHRDGHSEKRLYRCHVCDKEFKYLPNLKAHNLTHLEKTLACLVCGMKFRLPHHVRAHAKRAHQLDTD